VKAPGAILALALGKGKAGSPSEEEESAEPAAEESSEAEYKGLIADAAKAGDWDAFADAVAGLVRCSGKD
jgi:hypothetical protein